MDINGAKALKKRLEESGTDEASPSPSDVDVPEDAPPVYHWFGVGQDASETDQPESHDEPAAPNASLFRRLGLSFR
jgi:hypothetical protein